MTLTEREKKVLQHEMGLLSRIAALERQVAILGDACEQGCAWLEKPSEEGTNWGEPFYAGCALGYLLVGLLRAEGAGYKLVRADGKESDK